MPLLRRRRDHNGATDVRRDRVEMEEPANRDVVNHAGQRHVTGAVPLGRARNHRRFPLLFAQASSLALSATANNHTAYKTRLEASREELNVEKTVQEMRGTVLCVLV